MENQIRILESKIRTTPDSIEKVELLNQLSEAVRLTNIEQSLKLSNESIELSKKISYKKGLARSYWNSGICSRLLSKYEDAFESFEHALIAYNQLGDIAGKAKVINSMGNIYLNLSDYKYAHEYLLKCLKLLEGLNDKPFEASVLSNIGLLYQETGDYTSSLENYLKSMQIYVLSNLDVPQSLLNNIGIVYQNLGDYPTSLDYFSKSLSFADEHDSKLNRGYALGNIGIVYTHMKDYDNAITYLNESIGIFREFGNRQAESNALSNLSKALKGQGNYKESLKIELEVLEIHEEISDFSGKASALLAIGEIYFLEKNYELAEKYYLDGLILSRKMDDNINETDAQICMGTLYVKLNKTEEALEFLNEALELAERRSAKKNICSIHKILYEIYRTSGDYEKAFEHYETHFAVEKEINDIDSDRKLKSLSIQFQLQNTEKERRIALQEKEIYRLKNVELAEANENLIKLNEEKNEFMGIAAHDLKNPLMGIRSFSNKIRTKFDSYDKERISAMAAEMEMASERMFELVEKILDINAIESNSRNINPDNFNFSDVLLSTVDIYKERAEAKKISIEINCKSELIVYADIQAVRQILDNLISNAVKFTVPGKKILIAAGAKNNAVCFEITDGGPGFTESDKQKLFGRFTRLSAQPTGKEHSTGLGLSIAKKLTLMMSGKIWCESVHGEGAKFIVELPGEKKS